MTITENQIKVALYIRVSTEEQVEKYGKDLQLDAVNALIKSKGKINDGKDDAMVLAGENYIYIDEGISGTINPNERPAFGKLMEDIILSPEGKKPFDAVIVYKIDRFARSLKILLDIVDFFEEHNIQFLSANESIDTSSPFGKAILGILGVIAELEVETTKQRTSAGREQARLKGVYMGQSPPFGYIKNEYKTLNIFKEEAKVVVDIFNWFVYEGLTAQDIANRLKDMSILSPQASAVYFHKRKGIINKTNKNTFWRLESVRSILSDRIYIGEYWYNKTEINKTNKKSIPLPKEKWKLSEFTYPLIIEPGVFNAAQTLLEKNRESVRLYSSAREGNHIYVLSGLLKCGHCARNGIMMNWIGDRKKLPDSKDYAFYYKCGRKNTGKNSHICTVLPIAADPLEKYIIRFVMKLLKDPKMVYQHQQELASTKMEMERLKSLREGYIQALNNLPQQIENIRDQHTNSIIDLKKMTQEIAKRENKKKEYKEKINEIDVKVGQNALTEGYLDTFTKFSKKYELSLKKLRKNRKELGIILHTLIDRIIINSRPVLEIDSVAGRKPKDPQFMPYSIEIKLKLPEEIMTMLSKNELGVTSANL